MKKTILFAVFIVIESALNAQPVLTASNSNFVIGDVSYGFRCDPTSVSITAGGAGITWDYHSLMVTSTDTTDVVTCASTPYCDSFPSSTIAWHYKRASADTNYGYFINTAGRIEAIGSYSSPVGPGYVHHHIPQKMTGPFPLSYGAAWRDTTSYTYYPNPGRYDSIYRIDNCIADGYGTLKTPAGIFTNVLRTSTTYYVTHTSYNLATGIPSVSFDTLQYVAWRQPGNHFVLLSIGIDHSVPESVVYTIPQASAGVEEINDKKSDFVIYPVPASEFIHVKNLQTDWSNTTVTLINLAGKKLWHSAGTNIVLDEITIPLSNIGNGIYLLRIQTPTGIVSKKIVVDKQ